MLTGEFYRDTQRPVQQVPYARFPVQNVMEEVHGPSRRPRGSMYRATHGADPGIGEAVDDHFIAGED